VPEVVVVVVVVVVGAAMVIEKVFEVVLLAASFAWRENEYEAAVVGVPEMAPALESVNPAGRMVPEAMLHEYGEVPPVAASVVLGYAVPAVPLGTELVEMASVEVVGVVVVVVVPVVILNGSEFVYPTPVT
jgi:hypothetical protein